MKIHHLTVGLLLAVLAAGAQAAPSLGTRIHRLEMEKQEQQQQTEVMTLRLKRLEKKLDAAMESQAASGTDRPPYAAPITYP